MVPLSYETMDYAAPFSSPVCTDGIVGISSHTLRIIMPERLGEVKYFLFLILNFLNSNLSIRFSIKQLSL